MLDGILLFVVVMKTLHIYHMFDKMCKHNLEVLILLCFRKLSLKTIMLHFGSNFGGICTMQA